MKKVVTIIFLFIIIAGFKNDKPAYRIFNADGKKATYAKLLKDAMDADVVFFGELHNNPICHWLQYELTVDLYTEKNGEIVLGAEMFEADNQLILNEYLTGKISAKSYKKEARLWPNYSTDYAPLVDFAKDSGLMFIATNIPRRYASLVYKQGLEGLDALSAQAKLYIAPLPIEYDSTLNCYLSMLEGMENMGGHVTKTLPMAQAVKDATMAYNIAGYAESGSLFIHYNGSYHSDNFESILWYLNKYKPGLKIVTIASVEQNDMDNLKDEFKNRANFIVAVPEDMTKTH
ncbi:MAG: ChaN family lipoprotein [Bacteroidetes bacterium]|nr:ChaN family lipoprotein [Bacteroidota bacterium]